MYDNNDQRAYFFHLIRKMRKRQCGHYWGNINEDVENRWKIEVDPSFDGVCWFFEGGDQEINVWATPYFEGSKGIPVAVDFEGNPIDEFTTEIEFRFNGRQSPGADFQEYVEALRPLLTKVAKAYADKEIGNDPVKELLKVKNDITEAYNTMKFFSKSFDVSGDREKHQRSEKTAAKLWNSRRTVDVLIDLLG